MPDFAYWFTNQNLVLGAKLHLPNTRTGIAMSENLRVNFKKKGSSESQRRNFDRIIGQTVINGASVKGTGTYKLSSAVK